MSDFKRRRCVSSENYHNRYIITVEFILEARKILPWNERRGRMKTKKHTPDFLFFAAKQTLNTEY